MKSEYFLTESLLEPHAWLRNRVLLLENGREKLPSKSWILSVPHKDYDLGCEEKILMMKHPGYKHIIDLFYLDLDVPYLISERCDYSLQNAKLEQKYKQTPENKTKVYFGDEWKLMLQQVFEGIMYINQVGLIYHRDLTPSNVYWHKDKWVIADFGLAIHFQRQTENDLQKLASECDLEKSLYNQAFTGKKRPIDHEEYPRVNKEHHIHMDFFQFKLQEQRQYLCMDIIRFMYFLPNDHLKAMIIDQIKWENGFWYFDWWKVDPSEKWLISWHHLLQQPDPREWKLPVLKDSTIIRYEQAKRSLNEGIMQHVDQLLINVLGEEKLKYLKTCTNEINNFRNERGINCEKQLRVLPDPLY